MTLELGVTLVAIGFVGAFVSGLVGVGGAIVLIPLLYYLPPALGVGRLDIKAVAGVTMVQVLAATVVGGWTHGRHAQVHWSLAWTGGLAMAAGALVGAVASRHVEARVMLTVFALMATVALALMVLPAAHAADDAPATPGPFHRPLAVGCTSVIGLLAGLLGAGGAFLTLPVLIVLLRVPMRLAIGTSLVMTAMSATMGTLGKLATGQVPMAPTASVVAGALVGARVGAELSQHAPTPLLHGLLAAAIAAVTLRVWGEVLWH
jgi:uncharacterized membrane protein YfcA